MWYQGSQAKKHNGSNIKKYLNNNSFMLQFPLFSLDVCYLTISDGQEETKEDDY